MFQRGDKVVVAVSGGPDSVFLLYALNELRHHLSIDLIVVHFNHNLRRNSKTDEQFVKSLAKSWQLPCVAASKRVMHHKTKGSIEEIARKARIDFFMTVATKTKADKIALGHTEDDLAETVLMRLLRGTGLYGLRAICPVRMINNFTFVRPLLDLTKQQIIMFLKNNGIRFRIDPTNRKPDFFRNKIRLQLLPELKRSYNRDITKTLATLAKTASLDYEFIAGEIRQAIPKLRLIQGNQKLSISYPKLLNFHPGLQRLIFRFLYERLNGNTRRLTFDHIRAIEHFSKRPSKATSALLPNGIVVVKKGLRLVFARRNP